MEFSLLAVVVAMIQTLTLAWKNLINKLYKEAVSQLVVIGIGIGVTLLVQASDFGKGFIVLDMSLSNMNVASAALVGFALASTAMLAHKVIKSVDGSQSAVEPKVLPPSGDAG